MRELIGAWRESDPRMKAGAKVLGVAILLILILPLIFLKYPLFGLEFPKSSEVGDTMGGILGPLIAIIAAILTFLAFWIQYQANQIQIKNFDKQREDVKRENYQNKIYEMIKIHRDNVSNILSSTEYAANYFKVALDDLRKLYFLLNIYDKDVDAAYKNIDPSKAREYEASRIEFVYSIFWLGIDTEARKVLHDMYKDILHPMYMAKYYEYLEYIDYKYREAVEFEELPLVIYSNIKDEDSNNISMRWLPFNEHASFLGHYFRHLYQSVKYIDDCPETILRETEKYDFAKNIRAQLSNHEQLLLYYNSLSPFGKPWLDVKGGDLLSSYLIKYKMIKNIPLPLADFGIRPEDKFKKEIELLRQKDPPEELFEWNEIVNRAKKN